MCKDYLVSNVGVIAGGHYEEILNARLITITFIFSSFAYKICLTAHQH